MLCRFSYIEQRKIPGTLPVLLAEEGLYIFYSSSMGPFGASHYSLSFFIPLHPKVPPSEDAVLPEAASLPDAWKAVGLTYFLLKGLKRTRKTLKLIRDSAERYSNKNLPDKGASGTFGIDKGACRSIRATNHVSARPITNPNTAGYELSKLSPNAGQVSSPSKSNTSGVCRGEQKDSLVDLLQHFSVNALCESATSSSDECRLLTEESLKGFGLGLEGLMTTIMGLSKQAHSKTEVKEIITVVKTVDRVVEGVKAAKTVIHTFTSPVGDALHALGAGGNGLLIGFHTMKIVLKGVKISKGLITVSQWCKNNHLGAATDMASKVNKSVLGKRFKAVVKGLKVSEGAVNVVNITKEVGTTVGILDKVDHLLSWSIIMKGFKLTKSAIRVLEPLGSLPLGVVSALGKGILEMKGAVEGFSVLVKAFALSKQLFLVLLKGIGFTQGSIAAFKEFNRRSFLNKRSEEEYSQRTEVSFKRLCCHQQLIMPSIIWCLNNRWEFIERSSFTEEASFFVTAEIFGDVDDTSPLPLSFLMLAGLELPDLSV